VRLTPGYRPVRRKAKPDPGSPDRGEEECSRTGGAGKTGPSRETIDPDNEKRHNHKEPEDHRCRDEKSGDSYLFFHIFHGGALFSTAGINLFPGGGHPHRDQPCNRSDLPPLPGSLREILSGACGDHLLTEVEKGP